MKHIAQLFEYVTGLDTRIGYPNEHLAKGNSDEITSPMYATGVGLVIKGFQKLDKEGRSEAGEVAQGETKTRVKPGLIEGILKKAQGFFEED